MVGLMALSLSGCGLLERTTIPTPFPPRPPYGRVVREIVLEGNKYTKGSIILNTLVTRVGYPYEQEDATADYLRLLQLGVFTSISFDTEPRDDGIAVIVHLAEVSPYLPTVSFALTQENGVEIGVGLNSPNLFGRAARLSAYTRWGGARNNGIRYRDTWHPDPRWYACCYEFEFFRRQRANALDEFQEHADEFRFRYLYSLTDRFHLGPAVSYIGLSAGADSLGNIPDVTLDPDGRDEIFGLGLVMEYDTRNLSNYPTDGGYLELSGSQYGGFLGGPADYFRLEVDLRRYREITGPRHSLAFYSLLTLTSGEVGVDVPIYQDYHLGGTNSVRGWPQDPLGHAVGKNQWINTGEYWWNLIPGTAYSLWFVKWSMGLQLAAFADAGTAWDNAREFSSHWIAGGGVGARLTIPQVGLIRFDMAMGKLHPKMKVYLHIGGSEKAIAQKLRVR